MKRAKAKLSAEASGLSTPSTAADSSAAALVPFEDAPVFQRWSSVLCVANPLKRLGPTLRYGYGMVWYGRAQYGFEFAGLVNGLV